MILQRAGDLFRAGMPWSCTDCGYCSPCPHGVAIPTCLDLYNTAVAFDDMETRRMIYHHLIPAEAHASRCTDCGACRPRCPQSIDIPAALARIREDFEGDS